MMYFFFATGVVLSLIAAMAVLSYHNDRKLKKRIGRNFGEIPDRRYDEYTMESIESYWAACKKRKKPGSFVDDLTWQDLDLDSVFMRVNNTCSSVGEEYLFGLLHDQTCRTDYLSRLEQMVQFFDTHESARKKAQYALSKLGKLTANGAFSFFSNPTEKRLPYAALYPVLAAAAVLSFFSVLMLHASGAVFILFLFILNLIVHYKTKASVESEFLSVKYISSLIACAQKLSGMDAAELEKTTDRLHVLCAPLRPIARAANLISRGPLSDVDFITENLKAFFMIDFLMYNRMITAIEKHARACVELFELVGRIDTAISVASYRRSVVYYTAPEFVLTDAIEITDIVHPLIAEPVANSVVLAKSSIITGSNASGKSTFVKAVAINTILAQSIHTCLASCFRIKPSFVVSSMAVRDSIEAGDSYYIAEIKSLKRIIDGLSGQVRCLCLIDEILKGTNTIERIAASAAILDFLKSQNCLALVATHDIELSEIAADFYDNYHFQEHIGRRCITFDYKIYDGRATSRNAIRLLAFMNYPADITQKADRLAQDFEKERIWHKLGEETDSHENALKDPDCSR